MFRHPPVFPKLVRGALKGLGKGGRGQTGEDRSARMGSVFFLEEQTVENIILCHSQFIILLFVIYKAIK